jgi:hypothetical protein
MRIFDNFRGALRELSNRHSQGLALEAWPAHKTMEELTLPVPKEFRDGSMMHLARCFRSTEAAIETSFPRMREGLKEWNLYQPYQRPPLLYPSLGDYLSLPGNQFVRSMIAAENNAAVFARGCDCIASCFESFLVCFLPRLNYQVLTLSFLTERSLGKASCTP